MNTGVRAERVTARAAFLASPLAGSCVEEDLGSKTPRSPSSFRHPHQDAAEPLTQS